MVEPQAATKFGINTIPDKVEEEEEDEESLNLWLWNRIDSRSHSWNACVIAETVSLPLIGDIVQPCQKKQLVFGKPKKL